MKNIFNQYVYYRWIYIIGMAAVLINFLWLHNSYVSILCLLLLFGILFFKGIHILFEYKKAAKRSYEKLEKNAFKKKYTGFRIKVLLFWIAFIVLCIVAKFILRLDKQYFYSCTYFFLLLDRIFVNEGCLLKILSDMKKEVVLCCCGCPCRGWDLLMIHTPLLFALQYKAFFENIVIVISTALAILSMIAWEKGKYHLVEVRKKCATHCDLKLCREHLH